MGVGQPMLWLILSRDSISTSSSLIRSQLYKKYETSVTFSDGTPGNINATGNIVAEIPQILIELDPSYMITKDIKLWTSFRYFSKTYANINEAYYFNGHWETFGGLNWQATKRLALGCTVVKVVSGGAELDYQTGAKGGPGRADYLRRGKGNQEPDNDG